MAACLDEMRQSNNSGLSDALIAAGFVQAETAALINRHDGELSEALKEACERDRHRYGDGAVEHILGMMEPASLVTAALAIDDQIVTSAAAAAVAAAPTLLAELSLRKPQVQKVWIEALKREDAAWRIKPNIVALRNEVFDSFLSDELTLDLLKHLVSSPLGNVLDYPRRAEVWQALPSRCRNICLASTAKAWVESLPDRISRLNILILSMSLPSPLLRRRCCRR